MKITKRVNVAVIAVCITAFGIAALLAGQPVLAGTALGGLVGWLGGNKNNVSSAEEDD